MTDARWPARISLLVASLALSLLLVEIGYRVHLYGLDGLSPSKMASVRGLGMAGLLRASEHREIVYELEPELKTLFKRVPFETNSRGLRDREHVFPKPPGTFRVAVLGDSFTMGSGVHARDAYSQVLERRLNAAGRSPRYELVNFGVGGYGLMQYAGVMRHRILEYQPDLVLIGFCAANDWELPSRRLLGRPFRVRAATRPLLQSFVLQRLRTERRRGRARKSAACTAEQGDYLRSQLAEMGAFSREHGLPIVVAYLVHTVREQPCAQETRDSSRAAGLDFVEARLPVEGIGDGRYRIHALDAHPNEEAHAVFAERIAGYLEASGRLER